MNRLFCFIILICLCSCSKEEDQTVQPGPDQNELYFPPTHSDLWESYSFEDLEWDSQSARILYDFLADNGTRAFIILKDGKIVIEKYWGKNITNTKPFDKDTNWYWASAGKTLTAFLIGIAQSEGMLDINDKSSDYLGKNWTSLPTGKEELITIKHQLSMTTGFDYQVDNRDCTDPDCFQYKADAGTQWFYHNGPYTVLGDVLSQATGKSINDFTDDVLESKIAMDGTWISLGDHNLYWSNARSAARFGLLLLNDGKWNEQIILTDSEYMNAMKNSSQGINPAYGYLTWLNGKNALILPGLPTKFNTSLSKNAPSDLFAAMGKNGQYVDVVPSERLVVVRLGEAPDDSLVPTIFHNEMWEKINDMKK